MIRKYFSPQLWLKKSDDRPTNRISRKCSPNTAGLELLLDCKRKHKLICSLPPPLSLPDVREQAAFTSMPRLGLRIQSNALALVFLIMF